MNNSRILLACLLILGACHPLFAKSYEVASPDGKIKTTVTFDEATGTLTFQATSGESPIFAQSPLGILTNRARFTDGLKLLGVTEAKIDETYTLPQGKVSTYHNKANERTLSLEKGDQKLNMIFRAYDDGIAFRYAIPGTGDIEITGEATAFHVAGKPAYWGQSHPNAYGYEFPLGRIDHESYSLALLCELAESKHWVLLAQAATYSDYCIPHLTRADRNSNVLKVTFPIDQKEPIKTTLPFASPWRVAVISANDLATIVEQNRNWSMPTGSSRAVRVGIGLRATKRTGRAGSTSPRRWAGNITWSTTAGKATSKIPLQPPNTPKAKVAEFSPGAVRPA
jgi:alpha-glucosidase